MKALLLTTCIFLAVLVSGCGGNGGGGNTPTALGTPVNLATFKGYFMGYTSVGHPQVSFTLTGSDTLGAAWTGTYTITDNGPAATVDNLTVSTSTITMSANAPVSDISNVKYFLASNGSLYKMTNAAGTVSYTPSLFTMPSALANVGNYGSLATLAGSDGSTVTIGWELSPEFNGNSLMKISTFTTNQYGVLTTREVDTFYLNPAGTPYKLAISYTYGMTLTSGGVTVTMASK